MVFEGYYGVCRESVMKYIALLAPEHLGVDDDRYIFCLFLIAYLTF